MSEPYEECPRFLRCNANACPLDPEYPRRKILPGEKRCSLEKERRRQVVRDRFEKSPR